MILDTIKKEQNPKGASKIFVLKVEKFDRNGFKLAVDETSFDVYAHRKYYDYPPRKLGEGKNIPVIPPKSYPEKNQLKV